LPHGDEEKAKEFSSVCVYLLPEEMNFTCGLWLFILEKLEVGEGRKESG
jgi:hypothetical protein